jgi:hypothetical protein
MCKGCNNYSLAFNNILFQFNKNQLLQFKTRVSLTDIDSWLAHSSFETQRKKFRYKL